MAFVLSLPQLTPQSEAPGCREAPPQTARGRGPPSVRAAATPQPQTRSHAPPFTRIGVGGSEGLGGLAGELSCLPEQQPGHRSDHRDHGRGSQDAGERAPARSAPGGNAEGGACRRFTPPRERAATGFARDGSLGARARSVPPSPSLPTAPAPESSGVSRGCRPGSGFSSSLPRPLPPGPGRGEKRRRRRECSGLFPWERPRAPAARPGAPHAGCGAGAPGCRPPPPGPGIRIRAALRRVHPVVTLRDCGRGLSAAPAPPGLHVQARAAVCTAAGRKQPLTEVLVAGRHQRHLLCFSKGKKVGLSLLGT